MKSNSHFPRLFSTLKRRIFLVFLSLTIAIGLVFLLQSMVAKAVGPISVEILAAYNLVVDSNVSSPSTKAPMIATVAAKFCNTSASPITDVWGTIGNYDPNGDGNPADSTPGVYPSRSNTDPGFSTLHPLLDRAATYAFQHVGGSLGAEDARRYIGTLGPYACSVQYWHFKYPQCEANDAVPCDSTYDPVWGNPTNPNDDLFLEFDVWGTSSGGGLEAWTQRMTMRNEISAMANKIEPNPDGRWFNTASDVVNVGEVITSNGILYTFGVVNKGFDNDGDFTYDYNAWMQPTGDPSYDPSCFRLIRTTTTLTISRSAQPDLILNAEDQLYFTNLPENNTGIVGEVHYVYLALGGVCSMGLSPYQEAASGADNEKFNSDYGVGAPPIGSRDPLVTIDKSSAPESVPLGATITYQIPFQNPGPTPAGLTLFSGGINMPLVISDMVPNGLQYIGGSATSNASVTVLYSTNSGQTWSTTDPGTVLSTGPNNLVKIQWWLNDPLPAGSTGLYAQFQARPPAGPTPPAYSGSPFIENCADASFGNATPFARECDITVIQGANSIGDFVWRDENNDGQQTGETSNGLSNIKVTLYWDKNGDGLLDSGDVEIAATSTNASGAYSFAQLPNGNYLVLVDDSDPELVNNYPGYRPTTPIVYAVMNLGLPTVTYTLADFGFGPAFNLDKNLTSADPAYEGETVTYTINLTNNRPGDGSGQPQTCTYTTWGSTRDLAYSGTGQKAWITPDNIVGSPDSTYTTAPYSSAGEYIGVKGWSTGYHSGTPTSIKLLLPLQIIGTFDPAETLEVRIIDCGADGVCASNGGNPTGDDSTIASRTYNAASLTSGTLEVSFSSFSRAMTWADFNGSNIVVELVTNRQGNATGTVGVDAVAFNVSNGLTCNDPADVIDPLPLTDTFDPAKLEFVSASPPESSLVGGTLTWDNLGPLYPGETKTVTLVFKALEPPDTDGDGENDPTTHQNCALSSGAKFASSAPVNDDQDCVTHNINPTGTLGDTVWNDNGAGGGTADNGLQDGGEAGIPGVTVRLYTDPNGDGNPADGVLVATDVTDASGKYLFEGLRDGNYVVVVDPATLPGTTFTQTGDPDETGRCTTCDHDGSATLNNNNNNPADDDDATLDFGYRIPNTIFGSVWEDNDNDASRDSRENGLPGVTVYLDDCGADGICGNGDDGLTLSTLTGADGSFIFSDLADGNYRLRVDTTTLPSGATWSNTVDPEGAPGDSQSDVINASGGNLYGPKDFGYHRSGAFSIGDTLYVDWNGDGDQDSGEEGLPNVTIHLYQDDDGDGVIDPATDALLATVETDANGVYTFANLPAQSYTVVVDESDPQFPSGYRQTLDPDEASVCTVCDGVGLATLGPSDDTLDFGYQPFGSATVGDFVWQDNDRDGVQDAGEPGIDLISVSLYEDSNNNGLVDPGIDALVATTETDSSGHYLFRELHAGNYLVDIDTTDADLPTDTYGNRYVLTTRKMLFDATVPATDVSTNDPHDVKGKDAGGALLSLGDGEDYLLADFGFAPGGAIGNTIWRDDDSDGQQDMGEPGLSGVDVWLYSDPNGDGDPSDGALLATDTTDANGLYEFISLPAGHYVVIVDTADLPAGSQQTGDPDLTGVCSGASCDSRSAVTLQAGAVDWTRDFGYKTANGTIGDTLWIDLDGNGTPDREEPGIPFVTVRLYDSANNLVATTQTDTTGVYIFRDVPNGSYTVRVDTSDPDFPSGLTQTYDPDVPNPCSGAACDNIGQVTITGGSTDLTRDFGYRYNPSNPYSISGTVFFDSDNDGGLFDLGAGDSVLANVAVYLWDANCGADNLCGTTDDGPSLLMSVIATTSSTGAFNYTFSGLPSGDYAISLNNDSPQLTGMTLTSEPDDATCADNPACNTFAYVRVQTVSVEDQDFGFFANMDCGDLPNTYNSQPTDYATYLSDQGPCHIGGATLGAPGTIYMGAGLDWDNEPDGQPSATALGDDLNGDDEDAVNPLTPSLEWVEGATVQIQVTGVTGSNAYLAGWFDWNHDGNFIAASGGYDNGEYVFFGPLSGASLTLDVTIPVGSGCCIANFPLNARFRLYEGQSPPPVIAPTGNVLNGEVEDYQWPLGPTSVTLSGFYAVPSLGKVTLSWETVLELDAIGYNLYRATSLDGERLQLNSALIPSQAPGGVGGGYYEFIDTDVQPGVLYYYWLEFIDIEGSHVFDPVEAPGLYGIFLPLLADR